MSLATQVAALATRIATEIKAVRSTVTTYASYVTPMRYGAVGDGTTDDTTPVQAAFNSGRPVLIDRPYLVGGLTAASGLAVHGAPAGVLKRKSASTYTISINSGSGGSSDPSTNIKGVQFVGLTFDDDVVTNGFRQGDAQLNLNAASDVLVFGCTFTAFRSDAIYLGSANVGATERHNQRIKIIGNWFDGVNKDNRNAISIIDSYDLVIEGNSFRRCSRSDMPGPIDIEPNSGNTFPVLRTFKIVDNVFDDVGGSACIGTLCPAASTFTTLPGDWQISGNTFLNIATGNSPLNLLFAGDATTSLARMNIVVTDNTFIAVPRFAHFHGIRGVLFAGNTISGSTGAGMVGSNYACLDLTFDRNEFFQVGAGDGGAPCAVNVVNGTNVRFDGNTFIDCGLVDGSWGLCIVFGGPGASNYIDFVGTNVMRAGTRMTDVSYKSSTHTIGSSTTYAPPIGAVGGSALSVTSPSGAVPTSRTVSAGTGLTGGGDLSANRTLTVAYGTSSTTAAVGNDARLSDTRTPTDGTVTDAKVNASAAIAETKLSLASDAAAGTASRRTLGTGATQAAAGDHTHADVPTSRTISTTEPLTGGGDLSANRTLAITTGTTSGTVALGDHTHAYAPTASPSFTGTATFGGPAVTTPDTVTYAATTTIDASLGNHFRITMTGNLTLAAPSNPTDGQRILIELIQDGTGGRTLTLNSVFNVTTAVTGAITLTTTLNTRSYIGAVYRSSGTKWDVLAFATGVAA